MSNEKFSTDEWHLPHFATKKETNDCDCGFLFAGENGKTIGCLYYNKKTGEIGEDEYPDLEEAKANANFICAGTEMYKALVSVEKYLTDLYESNELAPFPTRSELDRIRFAIRKAVSQLVNNGESYTSVADLKYYPVHEAGYGNCGQLKL